LKTSFQPPSSPKKNLKKEIEQTSPRSHVSFYKKKLFQFLISSKFFQEFFELFEP